ncbi:MAG TPA: DUF6798 domain-containing protein [Gemmatimonadales bacterium]|nr:DUF6798 domain-containing protein [Gemmatimonadales bacterium]
MAEIAQAVRTEEVMEGELDRPTSWGWTGLILALLVAGADFGLNYGINNQNVYLLAGLRALRPDLLSHDWLASQTYLIHPVFSALIPMLARIGPLPLLTVLLNVLIVSGSLLAFRTVFRGFDARSATAATLLLATAFVAQRTRSVGVTYLFNNFLQPSSFAVCGMLLAIVCFLHGRYLVSGILLALGAAFHDSYLVLGIMVFGLVHLTLGKEGLIRRGLMQLLPAGLVLLKELPVLLTVAKDPQREASFYIFEQIRAPHHHYPLSFLGDYLHYIAWMLLALAAASAPEARQNPILRRLWRLQVVLVGLLAVSTLLTTVVFIPQVSMLFLTRTAPFSVLLSEVVVIHAILAKFTGRPAELAAHWPPWRNWLWGVGLSLPLVRAALHQPTADDLVLPLLLLVGTLVYLGWRRSAQSVTPSDTAGNRFAGWLAGLVLAAFLVVSLSQSTLIHGLGTPAERELYAWARTTDPASVFVIPPDMEDFRLQSERAIVVDWKASPVLASEILEWYRRIGRISGDSAVGGLDQAIGGYAKLTPAALASLSRDYGANYAVFRTPRADTSGVVYRNHDFVVLGLR